MTVAMAARPRTQSRSSTPTANYNPANRQPLKGTLESARPGTVQHGYWS
jgi:hypothetical protein